MLPRSSASTRTPAAGGLPAPRGPVMCPAGQGRHKSDTQQQQHNGIWLGLAGLRKRADSSKTIVYTEETMMPPCSPCSTPICPSFLLLSRLDRRERGQLSHPGCCLHYLDPYLQRTEGWQERSWSNCCCCWPTAVVLLDDSRAAARSSGLHHPALNLQYTIHLDSFLPALTFLSLCCCQINPPAQS